jgi:branched-chain amino acid aminotransferase
MHKFVFHNDRLLPIEQVRLSPGQAGLFHGWGIFTTLRVADGVPFAFERHWNRLARDASRIQIPLMVDSGAVRNFVGELIAANQIKSGCIRIYFVFNKATIWHSDESFPPVDLIIYSTDLPARVGPTQLAVMAHGRHAANPLTGAKVTAWLNNVWHVDQAHQRGFDDVILLNERDEVAECTAANIYCVKGQTVRTPPESSGCLLGVTREILLEISEDEIDLVEQALSLDDLYNADEVFITSTTRNVQPVGRIEDKSMPRATGVVTERLACLFSQYVTDYVTRARSGARTIREGSQLGSAGR